ncbi:MAG: leucine-rich repeat protein, partial [Prevotella sp.]|nr:leucine-rich repeat protein [Prevotella sp.]
LAFSQPVSANPIYSTQALKNAFAFLQEKGISVAPNGMRRAPSSNHSGELAPYYVFNLGDDKGFVIASGDDCAYPVLAYSDKGSMKLDSLPDNVKYWLDFYEAQVNSLKGSEAAASRPRNAPRAVVEPMLTTKWGQGEPYNLQCPVHPSFGSRCLTGCVATAMAQVMYYHRKNSTRQLTTYLPGYTCTNGEIQVPEVPKGSPIGWDDMIEDYEDNANCTREQKQAVAALMFYCGSSVRMSYGLAGSGAAGSAIPSALIKYFDYDDGVKMYERTNYSNTEWESMVYEELAAGNPIAYLGTRSNYEGHCFVVDGCDADGYVHINWGWKGQSDGYFLLTASSGNGNPVGGWTLYQEAMFGAVPNGDFPRLTTQSITLQSAETVEGLSSKTTFPVSFTMTVANLTDSKNSFEQAIGLYKNDVLQNVVATPGNISNLAVNGTKTMNVSLNMDATLPNGVYQLVPLSRATGTDKWRKNGNYDKMLTVVINGDKAKIVVGVPPVEGDIITFACNDVKHLCVENWDLNGDGEFSKEEAAAVSSLGKVFKENSSITSFGELVFFTGLTTIDGEAFRACEKLASVIIPENVETIGKYAFYYNDLKNIVIPKSVKEIGTYAFSGNKDIEDIRVESGNTSYDSRQGCHALVETATSTLLQGSKKTVIPDGIKAIGYNAFLECEWLGEMYIPESVTSIGNGAFEDCVNLKTVNIPKGVTKIGAKAFQRTAISSLFIPEKVEKIDIWAFYGCPNLAKIVVDEKNAVYDSRNGCNAILEKATNKLIQGCQTTVIPQGTESIGDYAFCGCNGLKTINIPGSVKSIGYEAFFYCDNLVRVDVSEGVETIGMYAFKGCDNLTTLTLPSTIYQIQWRAFDCDNLATVAVKMNNPIRLYDESFTRSYMATLYVPEGCASRYQDASYWKDFKNIVEGDIPQRDLIDFADMTVKNLCIEHWDTDGDRELSKEEAAAVKDLGTVFEENQQLTSFDELQYFTGLEKIGEDAFFEASNLESVTLPLQLKSIENGAFALCEKLQQIVVPKNVTAIGDAAFSGCRSMASVSLPEGLQSLGNVAFGSCSKLSKLTIPTSVTTIG